MGNCRPARADLVFALAAIYLLCLCHSLPSSLSKPTTDSSVIASRDSLPHLIATFRHTEAHFLLATQKSNHFAHLIGSSPPSSPAIGSDSFLLISSFTLTTSTDLTDWYSS
ncbi:hypothetical protein ECG_06058 [Echinococcus granulosus]|nr:hypothetical protein ECG_06058 [Echinococcus granulosus]